MKPRWRKGISLVGESNQRIFLIRLARELLDQLGRWIGLSYT